MTLKVDGTNGVLQAYDYQVLTTGFSYTFAAGTQTLVINPAGTLATGTVTMPASPVDGMVITVVSTQQVTAVTIAGNTGQSLVGGAAQLIPNQPLSFVYRLTNTTWYPFAGGAGRASSVVSGTAVASTSGTSIDFTSIPSWVKRITVMFSGVSTNGTSIIQVQIGDSGGIETTGYVGGYASNGVSGGLLSGIPLTYSGMSAVSEISGSLTISLLKSSTNTWVFAGTQARLSGGAAQEATSFGGGKSLSDVLDRVRITTTNGTDAFDAGTINILYE